ncbi:PPOX class F420-dependent oxidoreductase [Candidatus Poriferisodalis sp.]|uniref:PPOX class F420-dependent oxidoreductase n=1 Tax=Candidatus Poriferisodalis sp. TaxID=3101277 RepID=UPI003B51D221
MRPMSTSEALEFLSDGLRTGKLAWVAADGRPHVAPVWFIVEDGELLFVTGTRSGKALAMAREPRVSLVVDTEAPPYAFVKVDGVVEISRDLEELRRVSTLAGARYMGVDQAESFGERNSGPGECLVRLRPTSIVGIDGVAD